MEFHKTPAGIRYYNRTMPDLIESNNRLAKSQEVSNKLLEEKLKLDKKKLVLEKRMILLEMKKISNLSDEWLKENLKDEDEEKIHDK